MSENKPSRLEVVAGVILRTSQCTLLAQRPAGKAYAGWWEFPGGKVEAGESRIAALQRELREELALTVTQAFPWVTLEHDYPHAQVRLHFCRITQWQGEPRSMEQQAFAWYDLNNPKARPEPVLPATVPIVNWLSLPEVITIDPQQAQPSLAQHRNGRGAWIDRLEDLQHLPEALDFVALSPAAAHTHWASATSNPHDHALTTRVPIYWPHSDDPSHPWRSAEDVWPLGGHGLWRAA